MQDLRELAAVLRELSKFSSSSGGSATPDEMMGDGDNGGELTEQEIEERVNRLREWTDSEKVGLGIKTILTTAETARLSARPAEWFAEQLAGQIARFGSYNLKGGY
mgnify:FL=1